MTKVQEIRDLPDEALIERLESLKEELFNLRFQLATGQLDNPMRIKDVRHEVARILTVLRERHIERELEEIESVVSATPADAKEGSRSEAVAPGGRSAKRSRRRQEQEGR
jgi:large subunit ribosomal protein L29